MAAKKKNSRLGVWIAIILILAAGFAILSLFGPNTGAFTKGEYLYIQTGADYDKVKGALSDGGFVKDMTTFNLIAEGLGLPSHIHPGKYRINRGMSNFKIVRMLRSGKQTPVKIVINKLRTKGELVAVLDSNLEAGPDTLWQMIRDAAYLAQFGLDTNTMMCAILPDTYEFYWNSSADKAFRKIAKNYTRFWDDNHKHAAAKQGLTPVQAIIVASIVEEETNMSEDKPKIASVYLNRKRTGMKLQADPTVRFAQGDFSIRRIAGAMLDNPSPYNTYKYEGLPPGPICTPTAATIEAVLQAPKTTYLYFCASPDFSGHSAFATNYDEQLKNAHAYQQALDARGIH